MVTIQEIKEILKKRHITYQQLSDKTGISLGALKAIFRGQTLTPRIDTLEVKRKKSPQKGGLHFLLSNLFWWCQNALDTPTRHKRSIAMRTCCQARKI